MKTVTIVGVGMSPDTLTQAGRRAIDSAEMLFGAPRLLEQFGASDRERHPVYTAEKIAPLLAGSDKSRFAVLVSGDTGFYSAASALAQALFRSFSRSSEAAFGVCIKIASAVLVSFPRIRSQTIWTLRGEMRTYFK